MRKFDYLMVAAAACGTVGGAAADADIVYDLDYKDFGTGAGQTQDLADFSVTAGSFASELTADAVEWKRPEGVTANTTVVYTPDTGFSLAGATIDLALRRIAPDRDGATSDVVVDVTHGNRRFRLTLAGNDTVSPQFDSNPDTNSATRIFRFVFGFEGTAGAWETKLYVDGDPAGKIVTDISGGGSGIGIDFSNLSPQASSRGFALDWIGISSSVVDSAPVIPEPASLGLLLLGAATMLGRRCR